MKFSFQFELRGSCRTALAAGCSRTHVVDSRDGSSVPCGATNLIIGGQPNTAVLFESLKDTRGRK